MNIFNRNKYCESGRKLYHITQCLFHRENHEIVIKRKYKHFGNVLKVLSYNDSLLISASSNNNLYLYNLNQDCNEISTKPDL